MLDGNRLKRRECELLVEPLDLEEGRKALEAARQRTLWQMLADSARAKPDHAALVGGDDSGKVSRITYRDLVERATRLSVGLTKIGVRRGDRVVLWMTNSIEWVVACFAVLRIGAVLVPVNTFLKPEEIRYFVTQSGARHMIMLDKFRKVDFPEQFMEFCPAAASAKEPGQLFDDAVPDLRNVVLWSRSGGKLDCAYDFEALQATEDAEAAALADKMAAALAPSDLAMIKYTSGSTSFPKGVMLEHGGFVANAVLHSKRMPADGDDIYFSSMPLFHGGGSIYGLATMLANGGTLVFTEAFNADLAADLIVAEKATMMITVLGEEIGQAALARGMTFPSLRTAGIPADTCKKVAPNADRAFAAFGLTETYAPCSLMGYKPGGNAKCGLLLDGYEGIIVDPETGAEQPRGVPGELLVRGNLMRGYWNKPEESAKAIDKDGWFHSEDLVSMDEDGFLMWHGRLKLMLKVGGENVSIEEVERVVEGHPAVLQCGAAGVKDKRKTEAVVVYVVRAQGQELSADELTVWLKARLAGFKMPREITFVDALPRLGSGKLDRRTLSARALDDFPL